LFVLVFFLVSLGFEIRASRLLRRHSCSSCLSYSTSPNLCSNIILSQRPVLPTQLKQSLLPFQALSSLAPHFLIILTIIYHTKKVLVPYLSSVKNCWGLESQLFCSLPYCQHLQQLLAHRELSISCMVNMCMGEKSLSSLQRVIK
jgi:hypothetical protein